MIQATELANGFKVLTEYIPHVRSVAVGIWVDVGSRDENSEVAGISHFIEHLMFKGTARRSAKDIAEELDAVGGQLNAYTTKEYTCYYARLLDEHCSLAVDLLTDMVLNSCFKQEDIDKERNVIIEEIKMYEDAPDEQVHDLFAETIWRKHPLGRPIIGDEKTIADISREDVISFYQKYYRPWNIVVTVAGNFDQQQVLDSLTNSFGYDAGDKKTRCYTTPENSRQIICKPKDTEQVHLCLGLPGLEIKHEKIYVMQVINTVLGGGLSSRLFQEIREQRGLVYSIFSYHSSYHDTGLFCIYAGLSKKNVPDALELIVKEVLAIQQNGIAASDLQRAKDQLKGNMLLGMENISTRMSRLGRSQLYLGEVISPEETVRRIMAVTHADILELASSLLNPASFSLASVGPWEDKNIMEDLLKW